MRGRVWVLITVAGLVGAGPGLHAEANEPLATTTRVSVGTGGAIPDGASVYAPALSNEGRYVTFTSQATNLVSGDTNASDDAFVYDRFTKTTERVSVSSAGVQGNDDSVFPVISTDGRFVAYHSIATNLAPGDVNGSVADVFLFDRATKVTRLVSATAAAVSANGYSVDPNMSLDGRYIAYFSNASNIVPGDGNGLFDIYVYDVFAGTTSRISVRAEFPLVGHLTGASGATGDNFAPSISADGRVIVFHSGAPDLVSGDTNGAADIFVHDRVLFTTTRVSLGPLGVEANGSSAYPTISADGRLVAFFSAASNLVPGDTNGALDVFVRDLATGLTTRVMGFGGVQPNGDTQNPLMSADGERVAVQSAANNLVPGDTNGVTDGFVFERLTGRVTRASVTTAGSQANGASTNPAMSPDGTLVAFISGATNLAADGNGVDDVFLRDALGVVTAFEVPPVDPLPNPPGVPPCILFDPFNTTINQILACIRDQT